MSEVVQVAHLNDSALAATKRHILVDLSDTTNYKHTLTNVLELLKVSLLATLLTAGAWRVKVGLCARNSATNGDVYWLEYLDVPGPGSVSLDLDFRRERGGRDFGLRMDVASNKPVKFATNKSDLNSVWLQNDAGDLTDATGSTTKSAGVGDIVIEAEEVTDGGTLAITAVAEYKAH